MTYGSRAVLGALDAARPAIDRLSQATHHDDIAAAIVESWAASEEALRALVGQHSLGGQALIRELRQRNALTLDQAHALVEFGAAAERVRHSDYKPSETDVRAVRVGFQQLEAVAQGRAVSAERRAASDEPQTPISEGQGEGSPAVPLPARRSALTAYRRSTLGIVLAGVLLFAIVGSAAFYGWRWWSGPRALEKAREAYAAGRRTEAREMFTAIARRSPNMAEPHIYLGRMAREDGDRQTAMRELEQAVKLEPQNGTAHREMGSYLLSIGNPLLASRFYVRAIEADPRDRTAMGYLACALVQQGRFPEAQNFLNRAGQGPWSVCAVIPPPQPGMPQPPIR